MPITVEQGQELVSEFCRIYPAAYQLKYKVRATQEEIFGKGATVEEKGRIFGAYFPTKRLVALFTSNAPNAQHFTKTIRHEVLGHFGLNTLNPSEKRVLISAISETRTQPDLFELWSSIDKNHPKLLESFKAEEIFCRACETIEPDAIIDNLETRRADLYTIATMVANGLKDWTRFQQTFPATDQDQWSREGN